MRLVEELEKSFNPRIADALAKATAGAPFPSLLGIEVSAQRPGFLECRIPLDAKHMNGIGLVHGGVLTGLLDHALSIVVYPHVEVGKWAATLDLKVSYIAPVRGGTLVAQAHVTSLRKRIATVRIDVTAVDGGGGGEGEDELVATAMGTVYIKDPPKRA
jgi:acyl-CoA thioesterase